MRRLGQLLVRLRLLHNADSIITYIAQLRQLGRHSTASPVHFRPQLPGHMDVAHHRQLARWLPRLLVCFIRLLLVLLLTLACRPTDWFQLNPSFGYETDLQNLISEAQSRGAMHAPHTPHIHCVSSALPHRIQDDG